MGFHLGSGSWELQMGVFWDLMFSCPGYMSLAQLFAANSLQSALHGKLPQPTLYGTATWPALNRDNSPWVSRFHHSSLRHGMLSRGLVYLTYSDVWVFFTIQTSKFGPYYPVHFTVLSNVTLLLPSLFLATKWYFWHLYTPRKFTICLQFFITWNLIDIIYSLVLYYQSLSLVMLIKV